MCSLIYLFQNRTPPCRTSTGPASSRVVSYNNNNNNNNNNMFILISSSININKHKILTNIQLIKIVAFEGSP